MVMQMDFKRIKIIFIITFTLLNIYLFGILLEKNETTLRFGDGSATLNIEEAMKDDSIDFPTLSTEMEKVPLIKTAKGNTLEEDQKTLTNQTTHYEEGVLHSTLSEPIQLEWEGTAPSSDDRKPIKDFIAAGNILYGSDYSFFTYLPVRKQLVYTQVTNNIPIADGTGSIIFSLNDENEIISYEQTYAGDAEVQGSSRNVISEKTALESLYLNNQIPANASIRMMHLAYYRTLSLSDMDIYSPMWYVEIAVENSPVDVKRVDALTGTIISSPTVVVPENGSQSRAKSNSLLLLMEEESSSGKKASIGVE